MFAFSRAALNAPLPNPNFHIMELLNLLLIHIVPVDNETDRRWINSETDRTKKKKKDFSRGLASNGYEILSFIFF